MNPFLQAPAFLNSGPQSFIDYNQCEGEYYAQSTYLEQPPPPPKTPIRTPVMGTRTYQHRRTMSNASSQYSGRGGQVDYGEPMMNPAELDYRFNNFNITNAIEGEPLQFHSVPYSCNRPDNTNAHPVQDRTLIYENVRHFKHHINEASPSMSQNQTPLKTSYIETTSHSPEYQKSSSMTNSMRREMFFNPDPNPTAIIVAQCTTSGGDIQQQNETMTSTYSTSKVSGSTGCTPTHSTPQDSFSDDSSYLSALSSQNRVRFSPNNFLEDNGFSPTSRAAVANLQRAMVRRTMELEEGEKS